jgi:hypothetical protein
MCKRTLGSWTARSVSPDIAPTSASSSSTHKVSPKARHRRNSFHQPKAIQLTSHRLLPNNHPLLHTHHRNLHHHPSVLPITNHQQPTSNQHQTRKSTTHPLHNPQPHNRRRRNRSAPHSRLARQLRSRSLRQRPHSDFDKNICRRRNSGDQILRRRQFCDFRCRKCFGGGVAVAFRDALGWNCRMIGYTEMI